MNTIFKLTPGGATLTNQEVNLYFPGCKTVEQCQQVLDNPKAIKDPFPWEALPMEGSISLPNYIITVEE